jgi:hypothetical protein
MNRVRFVSPIEKKEKIYEGKGAFNQPIPSNYSSFVTGVELFVDGGEAQTLEFVLFAKRLGLMDNEITEQNDYMVYAILCKRSYCIS